MSDAEEQLRRVRRLRELIKLLRQQRALGHARLERLEESASDSNWSLVEHVVQLDPEHAAEYVRIALWAERQMLSRVREF